jgi:hypothetical protein
VLLNRGYSCPFNSWDWPYFRSAVPVPSGHSRSQWPFLFPVAIHVPSLLTFPMRSRSQWGTILSLDRVPSSQVWVPNCCPSPSSSCVGPSDLAPALRSPAPVPQLPHWFRKHLVFLLPLLASVVRVSLQTDVTLGTAKFRIAIAYSILPWTGYMPNLLRNLNLFKPWQSWEPLRSQWCTMALSRDNDPLKLP